MVCRPLDHVFSLFNMICLTGASTYSLIALAISLPTNPLQQFEALVATPFRQEMSNKRREAAKRRGKKPRAT